MNIQNIQPDKSISLFVKNIMIFEQSSQKHKTILPFFADGYPGLMFHQTDEGLWINPINRYLPAFFVYGQTITPIDIVVTGPCRFVVFQLYPFVLNSFFDVVPGDLNDKCLDLLQAKFKNGETIADELSKEIDIKSIISLMTIFLQEMLETKREKIDYPVSEGIRAIIGNKGVIRISELAKRLHLTERTFERRFLNEAGITAKQFAKIIQFQLSLEQISVKDYQSLSDIVYDNGFADQSHFIRVFKSFTGKTPLAYRKEAVYK